MKQKTKPSITFNAASAVKALFTRISRVNSGNAALHISMQEFILKYEQNKKINLLDVRSPEEYKSGHVPGAVLFTLNQVIAGAAIPFNKDREIYIICRSGVRSMTAAQYLKNKGYDKVWSVNGGTSDWIRLGKPVH